VTNRQTQTTSGQAGHALFTLALLIGGLGALGVCVWFIVTTDGPWDAVGALTWAWIGKGMVDSGVRRVLVLGRIEQAKAAKAAENTGVWKAHEAGSFTVRYEPDAGTWHVSGWTGPFTEYRTEVEWADPDTLRAMVEEAEREGMVPEDNPATRGIRARLMVKGWDEGLGAGIWPRSDA
jgi:hypothetical protein